MTAHQDVGAATSGFALPCDAGCLWVASWTRGLPAPQSGVEKFPHYKKIIKIKEGSITGLYHSLISLLSILSILNGWPSMPDVLICKIK